MNENGIGLTGLEDRALDAVAPEAATRLGPYPLVGEIPIVELAGASR